MLEPTSTESVLSRRQLISTKTYVPHQQLFIYNKVRTKTITSRFLLIKTKGGNMSIRLDYATKVWCVVLDCTRQVVFISVSLQQCKEKYPEALLYGKE